jgi:hypothetical protein
MVFVDDTNFLVELTKELDIEFRADRPPPSVFQYAEYEIRHISAGYSTIRCFWFASYQGSDEYRNKLRTELRKHQLEPVLFAKAKW